MVIIHGQHKVFLNTGYVIDQVYQNGFDGWRLRGLQHRRRCFANTFLQGLKSKDHVGEELQGVVITFIQDYLLSDKYSLGVNCLKSAALPEKWNRVYHRYASIFPIVG